MLHQLLFFYLSIFFYWNQNKKINLAKKIKIKIKQSVIVQFFGNEMHLSISTKPILAYRLPTDGLCEVCSVHTAYKFSCCSLSTSCAQKHLLVSNCSPFLVAEISVHPRFFIIYCNCVALCTHRFVCVVLTCGCVEFMGGSGRTTNPDVICDRVIITCW